MPHAPGKLRAALLALLTLAVGDRAPAAPPAPGDGLPPAVMRLPAVDPPAPSPFERGPSLGPAHGQPPATGNPPVLEARRQPPMDAEVLQTPPPDAGRPQPAGVRDQEPRAGQSEPEGDDADTGPDELSLFLPWWQGAVVRPMSGTSAAVTPDMLVMAALRHSPRVAALQAIPEIRTAELCEAQAAFDARSFVEASFDDLNEPVGNTLVTGGPPRLMDHNFRSRAGVRKRNALGGSMELAQGIGHQNSNSVFFVPNNQGNSRLALNYNQPLLNGFGRKVNRSQIVIANIAVNQAWDEVAGEMQRHLLSVLEGYWNVYYQRSVLLQRQRSHQRALDILRLLEGRRDLDASETQIARARAAAASRRLDVISSERDLRNAETDVRNLVQDPALASLMLEMVPAEAPARIRPALDLRASILTAIERRPEVQQQMREIKRRSVELDVARNDLLPVLDLVVSSYVLGLEGRSDIGQAIVNQFSRGGPSYTTGLVFEAPFGNRAAKARLRRKQAQIRMLAAQLQSTIGNVSSEAERAARNTMAAYERMRGAMQSVGAAELSLAAVRRQWELMPGDDRTASLLLDELLAKQLLLAQEEQIFSQAEFDYLVSLAELRRAEGTLLQRQHVNHGGFGGRGGRTTEITEVPAARGE